MAGDPIFLIRGNQKEENKELFGEVRATGDVSLAANYVFWNFWQRKQFPYSEIQEGQTLYWVDTTASSASGREIAIELRVTGVARIHYSDPMEAYETLEKVFGIGTEEANSALTNREAPENGYLLAVAVDPVEYIGTAVDIHWGKVGGMSGWAAFNTVLNSAHISESARDAIRSLPQEGRPPAAISFPIDLGAVKNLADLPRARRRPTVAAAKEIALRADGKCEMSGCDREAEHLDHIYPWAHGGNSEPVNLQWLCAKHNLKKSDKIPETFSPEQLWLRFESAVGRQIGLGHELRAFEARTGNSVYDVVVDDHQETVLVWKRGSRRVFIDVFLSDDELFVFEKDVDRSQPDSENKVLYLGERLLTSRIKTMEETKAIEALRRIGKKPGSTIDAHEWEPDS